MPTVVLKPRKEKPLQYRHPWIFAGAIRQVDGDPQSGDTVEVRNAAGEVLALGAWSPQSQIAVRIWSFDPAVAIDAEFFRTSLQRALAGRPAALVSGADCAVRLVHAESDGLPGLVVDRYGEFLICQFLSAGADRWRDLLVRLLRELVPCRGIYERSDVDIRAKEGLPERTGSLAGQAPPDWVTIRQGAIRLQVDLRQGHKTGGYLDQAVNRERAAAYLAGREVLDCFTYSGGFAAAALVAGARHVTAVDSSAPALALARQNLLLNEVSEDRFTMVEGNVAQVLRQFRDARREFDAIILDPPKFVAGRHQLEAGGRAYKDINLLALKLLRPGGILVTFSCSQAMVPEPFQQVVAYAAADAGRTVQILERLSQAPDHPVALSFPEGAYLKGLICRVL